MKSKTEIKLEIQQLNSRNHILNDAQRTLQNEIDEIKKERERNTNSIGLLNILMDKEND